MTTAHCIEQARVRSAPRADDGFTVIEVIVSFVIFAIVAASAATAIYRAIHAAHLSQQRTDAAAIAQAVIADAIARANLGTVHPETDFAIQPNVGDGTTADREDFTALRTITFDQGDTCSPGTLFTVNVVVKQRQTGMTLARSDTRVACPPA